MTNKQLATLAQAYSSDKYEQASFSDGILCLLIHGTAQAGQKTIFSHEADVVVHKWLNINKLTLEDQ